MAEGRKEYNMSINILSKYRNNEWIQITTISQRLIVFHTISPP
jgi:hypothetical protein